MSTHDESVGGSRGGFGEAGVGRSGGFGYGVRPHRHVGGRVGTRPGVRSDARSERSEVRSEVGVEARSEVGVEGRSGVGAGSAGRSPGSLRLARLGGLAGVWGVVSGVERWLVGGLRRGSVPALRVALGLVFVWFGALKVSGDSPVGDLVAGVAPWLPRELFIVGLGVFEVVLGVALLVGYRLVWVALLMVAHLAGTFLVFLTEPAAAFSHGNPLLVTMAGEFVAKNVVLIAAGLVLVAFAHGVPHEVPDAVPEPVVPAG